MVIDLIFRGDNCQNHIQVVIAASANFEMGLLELLEATEVALNHGCGGHPRKAVSVQKVGGYLSDTGFSGENSSPKGLRSKATNVVSRIVGREGLLVNWLKDSKGLLGDTSHEVRAACAIVSKLGLQSFLEAQFDVSDCRLQLLGALHGAEDIDVIS